MKKMLFVVVLFFAMVMLLVMRPTAVDAVTMMPML